MRAAGLAKAKVLVVAVNRPEDAVKIVRHARAVRPDIHIIARARDRVQVYALLAAGADDIVREMFDSSLRAGRYVLENIGLSEFEASEVETAFYKHDRSTIRELSELWKPGVHTADNDAYIKRAIELQNDLETALLEQLETDETVKRGPKTGG
jgi:CPA2 family monovalent cation:H+ antiporter-2